VIDPEALEIAALARKRLGISIATYALQDWPLRSVSSIASGVRKAGASPIQGFGGGGSPEEAGLVATMESVERYSQFRSETPAPKAVAPWEDVRSYAISPLALGLYSSAQYAAPDFPCGPFDPAQPLEWIGVTDMIDGTLRLAPCEFIYPNAALGRRPPLVCETSSGTAAHLDQSRARLAALCEAVERDAAMLFWYRQPPTTTLDPKDISDPGITEDLGHLRSLGYVVVIASLDYDLGIPCFLAVAKLEDRYTFGLGCHPAAQVALLHAVRELCCAIAWLSLETVLHSVRRSFALVRLPTDHQGLYTSGPRHEILRRVLARTLQSGTAAHFTNEMDVPALTSSEALALALQSLASRGFRAYTCEITPGILDDTAMHVARVLVPGLVPLHFGFDRLRLGCERLWNNAGPGRLRQLLPHFLH
jgi:ribosomal protein S12 methylthiotransferase accessory factor